MLQQSEVCKPKGARRGSGGTVPGKPQKNGKNSFLCVKNSFLRTKKQYKALITN